MQTLAGLPVALRRRRFIALTAAGAMLGLPGCAARREARAELTLPTDDLERGFKRIRKRVQKSIPDASRRARMIALVDQAERALEGLDAVFVDWRRDLAMMPSEHRRDAARLAEITTRHNERVRAMLMKMCEIAVESRAHALEGEWRQIFPDGRGGA